MDQRATHQRYYDQRISGDTVFVLPGYHFVIHDEDIPISTLLGSCVSACIRDTSTGSGGLNHFLLPESSSSGDDAQSARYGVHAMEVLINDLLKSGSQKKDLEAKIFGGGQVIKASSMEAVGSQNGSLLRIICDQNPYQLPLKIWVAKSRVVYTSIPQQEKSLSFASSLQQPTKSAKRKSE